MSIDAINWVAKQTTGDAKSKAALFWLAFHHNAETGVCCPSNRTLMAEMEVGSDNTVRLALNRLRELGLISWAREYKNGAVARTLFTLNFKVEARPSVAEGPSVAEVPQPLREGQSLREGTSMAEGGCLNGCGRVPQPLRGNKERNKERNKEENKEGVAAPSDAQSSPTFSEIDPPFDETLFGQVAQGPDPDVDLPPEPSEPASLPAAKKPRKRRATAPVERPADVSAQAWDDWMTVRKAKRLPVTPTALAGIRREAEKAGVSLTDAITLAVERGWAGFRADWIRSAGNNVQHPKENRPLQQDYHYDDDWH